MALAEPPQGVDPALGRAEQVGDDDGEAATPEGEIEVPEAGCEVGPTAEGRTGRPTDEGRGVRAAARTGTIVGPSWPSMKAPTRSRAPTASSASAATTATARSALRQ